MVRPFSYCTLYTVRYLPQNRRCDLLIFSRALTNGHEPSDLRVYITGDGSDVYEDTFMSISKPDGVFKPTLILVGTRLGLDKITPVYWEALKTSLQMPQSIGIAGYAPKSHCSLGKY
jgi:hypothetical protein